MTAKEKLYKLLCKYCKEEINPEWLEAVLNLIANSVRYSETDRAIHGFTKKQSFEMLTEGIGANISGDDPEIIEALQAAVKERLKESGDFIEELESAYNLPTGPLVETFLEIIGAGANLPELPERKRRVTHSATYEVVESTTDKNHQRVTKETVNEYLVFEFDDIEKLNEPTKNIFIMTLIELNKQALFNGVLTRDYITFPLQALVDNGMYSSKRAARRGFIQGADGMTSFKASGYTTRGKEQKQILNGAAIAVLFTEGIIDNDYCTVYINPRIAWDVVAPYYTLLPKYYFKLSSRAKDLLNYIFYLARQHVDEIKEKGSFTISFKAIHARLNLPEDSINPGRDIIAPIENAIEEIEEENKLAYKNRQFNLLPIYPKPKKGKKRVSVSEFIDKGKLKVSLTGELADKFDELSKQKTKKIEAARKKAERIEEKAAAIKKAKST